MRLIPWRSERRCWHGDGYRVPACTVEPFVMMQGPPPQLVRSGWLEGYQYGPIISTRQPDRNYAPLCLDHALEWLSRWGWEFVGFPRFLGDSNLLLPWMREHASHAE